MAGERLDLDIEARHHIIDTHFQDLTTAIRHWFPQFEYSQITKDKQRLDTETKLCCLSCRKWLLDGFIVNSVTILNAPFSEYWTAHYRRRDLWQESKCRGCMLFKHENRSKYPAGMRVRHVDCGLTVSHVKIEDILKRLGESCDESGRFFWHSALQIAGTGRQKNWRSSMFFTAEYRIIDSKIYFHDVQRTVQFPNLSLEVLQYWKRQCTCETPFSMKSLPHSMTKIRLIDTENLHIVDMKSLKLESIRYVALSYVWGQSNPARPPTRLTSDNMAWLTTKNSLVDHRLAVPRYLIDVMKLCHQLGYRYLWIDRFCIPQDDSPESIADKMHQIQNMHFIYENASLTICITDSYDDNVHLARYNATQLREFWDIDGRFHFRDFSMHPHQAIDNLVKNTVWRSRGWTLQEEYLSRRRLYLTSSQAAFYCSCFCATESQSWIQLPFKSTSSAVWPPQKIQMGFKNCTFPITDNQTIAPEFMAVLFIPLSGGVPKEYFCLDDLMFSRNSVFLDGVIPTAVDHSCLQFREKLLEIFDNQKLSFLDPGDWHIMLADFNRLGLIIMADCFLSLYDRKRKPLFDVDPVVVVGHRIFESFVLDLTNPNYMPVYGSPHMFSGQKLAPLLVEYIGRSLTNITDSLNGFLGILGRRWEKLREEFYFGMAYTELKEVFQHRIGAKTHVRYNSHIPTWSWAHSDNIVINEDTIQNLDTQDTPILFKPDPRRLCRLTQQKVETYTSESILRFPPMVRLNEILMTYPSSLLVRCAYNDVGQPGKASVGYPYKLKLILLRGQTTLENSLSTHVETRLLVQPGRLSDCVRDFIVVAHTSEHLPVCKSNNCEDWEMAANADADPPKYSSWAVLI